MNAENHLKQALLNDYQRDFPLVSQPYLEIAKAQNTQEKTVLNVFKSLKLGGLISRIGPVFRPNTIGVSTLAAMKVPSEKLEAVADLINQYDEVNHNYEREHDYNVWFVATAPEQRHLERTLCDIEQKTGIAVMRLPLVKEYHIDLGFNMQKGAQKHQSQQPVKQAVIQTNDTIHQQLISEIQIGLPLVERPFAEIAIKLGINEETVINRIQGLLENDVIRRIGVVVRHRELGYRANAMVVWDFPDDKINEVGKTLSRVDCVTLCYERPRHLPHWPYNLFTMIHGKDKPSVNKHIADIIEKFELENIPSAILYSKRRFKQKGACYSYTQPETNYQRASNE